MNSLNLRTSPLFLLPLSLLLLVSMLVGVVFAQGGEAPAVSVSFGFGVAVLTGLLGGVGYSLLGYFKERAADSDASFNPKALAGTLLVGAIVGTVFGATGGSLVGLDIVSLIFTNFTIFGGVYALRKAIAVFTALNESE